MGWTWEVEAYTEWGAHQFSWDVYYTGESLIAAIKVMREAKKTAGAVRLTWR